MTILPKKVSSVFAVILTFILPLSESSKIFISAGTLSVNASV